MRLLKESFRWYGPGDCVGLWEVAQSGASGVFTSLHSIPYGEPWSVGEIEERKKLLGECGLDWDAVESLPVSEDIKLRGGDFERHIENYKESIRNLASCGIRRIIYNFMPVLDWIRTDLNYRMPDGSTCLRFDPAQFAAFEIFVLKRAGAESDYSPEIVRAAGNFFSSLTPEGRDRFGKSIIDMFPGCKMGLEVGDVVKMLARYEGFDAERLRENLRLFLDEVLPTAEECGAVLAIHPDDPPFPVLGLPRIASSLEDFEWIFTRCRSESNAMCFCAGSLSSSPRNDLLRMVRRLRRKICAAHLRSTQITPDGGFYESGHLEGGVPMLDIVAELLDEQRGRLARGECEIPFRPDHGRVMAGDLLKAPPDNPGYSYIGRMKGLAELRGLQTACAAFLERDWHSQKNAKGLKQ